MQGWKRITRTRTTLLAKNNLAAPNNPLGDCGSLTGRLLNMNVQPAYLLQSPQFLGSLISTKKLKKQKMKMKQHSDNKYAQSMFNIGK